MPLYSKIFTKLLLLSLLLVLTVKPAFSQKFSPTGNFVSYWQIQLDGGSSLFFGDIKQYQWWPVTNYENEWKSAVGLQVNKQLSPVFGIRVQGLYGQLAGTRRVWNKHFDNDYYEFNLNTNINLNNIFARYRADRFFNVYIVFGIGLLNYNTNIYELGTNNLIQSVGGGNGKSFGGRTLEGVMLGGIGFDFRLSKHWNLNLQTVNRAMNSDMLDGYIGGFKYDVYNVTTLGLAYKFAYSKKHAQQTEEDENAYSSRNKTDEVEIVDYEYIPSPVETVEPKHERVLLLPNIVGEPLEEEPIIAEEVVEEIIVVEELVVVREFEYRVQIIAKYGNTVSINKLSKIYNIPPSQIRQDTHSGHYIYSVGPFDTYEQARAERNKLRTNNGISDAFVIAFRNGNRLDKLP